jgi:hypothetical protein
MNKYKQQFIYDLLNSSTSMTGRMIEKVNSNTMINRKAAYATYKKKKSNKKGGD